MPTALVTLDAMPSTADFYRLYWNRQPFLVRGAIAQDAIAGLISADELAGLSMEEAPRSRMVMTKGAEHDWTCRFGPFAEEDFATAGEADWSLLVQNVEQFHPDTAALLGHFNFAPRWLMDDIMVSYSAPGGSVGPHIDSYHVFLVQGEGSRRWKVGRQVVGSEVTIEGLDLKILQDGFEGDEITVGCGDVLYLPPKFAHEGVTLESSLTFSVGFLGPKLSELYSGYAQYLAEVEGLDDRYVGAGLAGESAGFAISSATVESLRDSLTQHLGAQDFSQWLVEFFTESSHEDLANYTERDAVLSLDAFTAELQAGAGLCKPPYVKFAVTAAAAGTFYLGVDNHSFVLDEGLLPLIRSLMMEQTVTAALDNEPTLELLRELYNHEALEFTAPV